MAAQMSLRLPGPLKDEASAYADALGISVNALCAVALRDYLDRRKGQPAETTPPAVVEPAVPAPSRSPAPLVKLDAQLPGTVSVPIRDVMREAIPPVKRKSKSRKRR